MSPNSRSSRRLLPVPLKDHYATLGLTPTASPDEVKAAFRQLIARYHPDKVQHLGTEFQELAAERASELTEAYRVLSHEDTRAEYDGLRSVAGTDAAAPPAPASKAAATAGPPPPDPGQAPSGGEPSRRFSGERATRDTFVRKAMIERLQQAFGDLRQSFEERSIEGFDLAWVPRATFLLRGTGPRLLVKFVSEVDAATIRQAWASAAAVTAAPGRENCVILIGMSLSPPGELGRAINDQRRRARGLPTTLVPVDARDWRAHLPADTPAAARNLLARPGSATENHRNPLPMVLVSSM
jgi:hypothetical protein